MNLEEIQNRVNKISIPENNEYQPPEVPNGWKPWESKLSPSALYNCGLPCRKKIGMKAPEVKLLSVHRWNTITSKGINLPFGIYFSVKRHEQFVAEPKPHLLKTEYNLILFPYGNVWSQKEPGMPITEEWLFSDSSNGKLILEELMIKDALTPIPEYFEVCYEYMMKNPEQIGIHLKRKKSNNANV